jgi:NADH dehydrogenase
VVIGGGFGGLAAVHGLRDTDVDVTLIDRHTYTIFQPLLYQVATATLNADDNTWFLRSIRAPSEQCRVSAKHGPCVQNGRPRRGARDRVRLPDHRQRASPANFSSTFPGPPRSRPFYTAREP